MSVLNIRGLPADLKKCLPITDRANLLNKVSSLSPGKTPLQKSSFRGELLLVPRFYAEIPHLDFLARTKKASLPAWKLPVSHPPFPVWRLSI
jgi:hypothetical protein